jgi:uncharacterized protein (DUF302 family)
MQVICPTSQAFYQSLIYLPIYLGRPTREGVPGMQVDGLITMQSSFDIETTLRKLEAVLHAKGLIVFATIDHAAGAAQVDMPLRPTILVIFGSPKSGTPLMQAAQTSGIDLPLKALIWQDAANITRLSYNDPAWIAKRHGLQHEAEAAVNAMANALHALAVAATKAS